MKYSLYEWAKEHKSHVFFIFILLFLLLLLFIVPPWQVHIYGDLYGLNKAVDKANLENECRATLVQFLGSIVIIIGLYYTARNLKIAQENLKVIQEGQITERFTRAIDQLGNPNLEIKLGGIHALERIANESKDYYWPTMEILTAYIRNNSSIKNRNTQVKEVNKQNEAFLDTRPKVSLDIQTILIVVGQCMNPSNFEKSKDQDKNLDLQKSHLREANLKRAKLSKANLKETNLIKAELQEADLSEAELQDANLGGANLREANLQKAKLEGANLREANLTGAKNLSVDQLSKVKTLYETKLDENLRIELKNNKHSTLLEGGAKLEGANLTGAELEWACLKEAKLNGAKLEGANLGEATL